MTGQWGWFKQTSEVSRRRRHVHNVLQTMSSLPERRPFSMQTFRLWLMFPFISTATNMGKKIMNWECSRSVNQAGILISPHNTNILDIVISKSLEPEWYLAAAAGLLFSGFVKTNDGQWILIIFYLCLCKHSRCQRTQSPRCSDDPARLKERGNLNSCDPSVTKTKRAPGQQNECHLNAS